MIENNLTGKITADNNITQPQKQSTGGFFAGAQIEGITPFKEEFDKMLQVAELPIAQNIDPYINFEYEDGLEDIFKIDTQKIENQDAVFFLNIAQQGESINIHMNDEISVIDASNYKTMEVSKTLGDILLKAQENNKSLRLDFDNQVTVILKVASDGKIDASFIPQNKEVEKYLKNNIDYLKVRFDEQSIGYSNISYKPYKEHNGQGQRQRKQGTENE